jgi:hypothetical protein
MESTQKKISINKELKKYTDHYFKSKNKNKNYLSKIVGRTIAGDNCVQHNCNR